VTVLADDDVVVHDNAERSRDLDDRLDYMDVGLRWRGIAGGMVVIAICLFGANIHSICPGLTCFNGFVPSHPANNNN